MSLLASIRKFIIEMFWPWFVRYVWPFIKEHVYELLAFLIGKFKELVQSYFDDKYKTRAEEASKKAQQAEDMANNTANATEADQYRATANVWREVAEQYRRDNEELKRKLEEYEGEVNEFADEVFNDMNLDADFSGEEPIVKIGNKQQQFPALSE